MDREATAIMTDIWGAEGKGLAKTVSEKFPELAPLIQEFALKKVWARKGISLREKSIATIASQVALSQWEQVDRHFRSFLSMGGSREELQEILIHLTVYCGFPPVVKAFEILHEIP